MRDWKRQAIRLLRDQNGATAIEYGLIMSLMTIGLIAAVSATGGSTEDAWNSVADDFETAVTGAGS